MSGSRVEPGNAADKALTGSLDALETDRGELLKRVSVAPVGVTGSAGDGFQIDLRVLRDMNAKVETDLERKLALAERLQDRSIGGISPEPLTSLALKVCMERGALTSHRRGDRHCLTPARRPRGHETG